MSNSIGRRVGPGLLTPGSQMPRRAGFGLARGNSGANWGDGNPIDREDVTESGLASFQQQPTNRQRQTLSRRAYAKVRWAYTGHHAFASCVDFIAGCALTNGEDPARRVWRMVPVRDEKDEPIKNPDESQLEPVLRFLNNCHPTLKFEQLLKPMMTDFVAANALNAEIALSKFLVNPDGEPQPGALYTLPQIEIFPIVDERGELNQTTPFAQIRPGQKPTMFTWPQSLWMTDGYMGGPSVNPMTPVDSIITQVHTMIEAQKYVDSFFTSGAKMGTVFKGGESWTAEEAIEFLLYIEQNYLKSENGHKPYVLYGDVDIRDLPQNAHEFAQYIEIMRAMVNGICSRFPLDPRLISAESQGSALGNKGERQHVWTEALNGPVNRKKKAFGAAFTDRVIHKGFGATDWALELVPFTNDDDAERMSQMATALKTANESKFVSWNFQPDIDKARQMFDGEFKELTEQEFLEFFAPDEAPALPPPVEPPVEPAPDPGDVEGQRILSALRFNPYHADDGKFSDEGGHSTHSSGGTVTRKEKSAPATTAKPASGPPAAPAAPKEFTKDTSKAMDKATQEQFDSLDDTEKRMLNHYSRNGSQRLNQVVGSAKGDQKKLGDDAKTIKTIDSAIAKGRLEGPMTLYRGVEAKHLGGDLDSLVGATITDHGYGSTTADPKIGEKFSKHEGRVMMQISAPAGAKGLWLGSDKNRTPYPKEAEMLLPRGSKYNITKVERVGKRTIVHAELVHHG